MILQLNPPIPVTTPSGKALAHALLDYGPEYDLIWVVFMDDSGECWSYSNKEIRAQKNITMGRDLKDMNEQSELDDLRTRLDYVVRERDSFEEALRIAKLTAPNEIQKIRADALMLLADLIPTTAELDAHGDDWFFSLQANAKIMRRLREALSSPVKRGI